MEGNIISSFKTREFLIWAVMVEVHPQLLVGFVKNQS